MSVFIGKCGIHFQLSPSVTVERVVHDFLKEFPDVNLSKPLEIKHSAGQTLNYHIKGGKDQNISVYLHSGR